ncbi:MAG: hypothetical protein NTV22_04475 [bacterium]|nr:hypothetical protein [bacterium]
MDDGGTVFVAGFTYGALDGQTNAGGADAVLCVYAPDGTWQWTALRGSASDDFAQAVAVDTAGGLARVSGYTYGTLAGQPNAGNADAFTLEYLIPEPAPLVALGVATCLLRRARRRGSPSHRCP